MRETRSVEFDVGCLQTLQKHLSTDRVSGFLVKLLEAIDGRAAEIAHHGTHGDLAALDRAACGIAESASVIGAARLCGLARELRVLCRAGRHDAVSELATRVTAAASATSVALRAWLDYRDSDRSMAALRATKITPRIAEFSQPPASPNIYIERAGRLSDSRGGGGIATKVLFLSYGYMPSGRFEPYRERIIEMLAGAGAQVLAIKTNGIFKEFSHQAISADLLATTIEAIRQFDPDLVLSINRSGLCKEVTANFRKDTRTITWFQDPYYYATPELLEIKANDILVFFIPAPALSRSHYQAFMAAYRPDKSQVLIPPFVLDTLTFFPRQLARSTEICFVGSSFPLSFSELLLALGKDHQRRSILLDVFFSHREKYQPDIAAHLSRSGFDLPEDRVPPAYRAFAAAVNAGTVPIQGILDDQINLERRIQHLAAVTEFGLSMYGSIDAMWVPQMCIANPELLRCYHFQTIDSAEELAALYNRSKIALNISRVAAANSAFSFRVPEILASGALLLTEAPARAGLEACGFEENRHYVSFSSPADLKAKCAYYLRRGNERTAIAERASRQLLALRDETSMHLVLANSVEKAGDAELGRSLRALTAASLGPELYARISFLGEFAGSLEGKTVHDLSTAERSARPPPT